MSHWSVSWSTTGTVFIELMSDDFDSYLELYRGDSGAEYDLIGEDDDSGSGYNSRIERRLTAGRYYVVATSLGQEEGGSYELVVGRNP